MNTGSTPRGAYDDAWRWKRPAASNKMVVAAVVGLGKGARWRMRTQKLVDAVGCCDVTKRKPRWLTAQWRQSRCSKKSSKMMPCTAHTSSISSSLMQKWWRWQKKDGCLSMYLFKVLKVWWKNLWRRVLTPSSLLNDKRLVEWTNFWRRVLLTTSPSSLVMR